MTTTIDLGYVIAMLLGLLAALCAVSSIRLNRSGPLAWTAAALAITGLQAFVVTLGREMVFGFALETVLEPISYLLAGQTIYALAPELGHRGRTIAAVLALAALSVTLHGLDAPFYYQAAAFELACFVAMADAVVRMVRHARTDLLHRALTVSVIGLWLITVVRLFVLVFVQPLNMTLDSFGNSPSELAYMIGGTAIAPIIISLLLIRIIADTIATYQHQSERDGLTGLFNRRAFDAMADARAGTAGAVIFCDIDHFKLVNDRFGHQTGDDVICAFAALIAPLDAKVARIGGEEFALLLPGRSAAEAVDLAESIRRRFNDAEHTGLPVEHRISASFGVATYGAHETARHAISGADAALYQAKSAGRNRVMVFAQSEQTTASSPAASQVAA